MISSRLGYEAIRSWILLFGPRVDQLDPGDRDGLRRLAPLVAVDVVVDLAAAQDEALHLVLRPSARGIVEHELEGAVR